MNRLLFVGGSSAAVVLVLACGVRPAGAQCAFAMQFQVQIQFQNQAQVQQQQMMTMQMQMMQQRQMQQQQMMVQHLAMHQQRMAVPPMNFTQVQRLSALQQTTHVHQAWHVHAAHLRNDLWLWPWLPGHGHSPHPVHPIHLTWHQSRLFASGHQYRVTHLHQVHHEQRVTLYRPGMERHVANTHRGTALHSRTTVQEQRHVGGQRKVAVRQQEHRHTQARVQLRVTINTKCGSCHVTPSGPTVVLQPRLPQVPFGLPKPAQPIVVGRAPPPLIPAFNPIRPRFPVGGLQPGLPGGPVAPPQPGPANGPALLNPPPGPFGGRVAQQPGPFGGPAVQKPDPLGPIALQQPPALPSLTRGPTSSSSPVGLLTSTPPDESQVPLPESSPGLPEYSRPPDLPVLEGTTMQLASIGGLSEATSRPEADEDSSLGVEDVLLPPPLPPLPDASPALLPQVETVARAVPAPSPAEVVLMPPPLPSLP